jgi:hypothetical protein
MRKSKFRVAGLEDRECEEEYRRSVIAKKSIQLTINKESSSSDGHLHGTGFSHCSE